MTTLTNDRRKYSATYQKPYPTSTSVTKLVGSLEGPISGQNLVPLNKPITITNVIFDISRIKFNEELGLNFAYISNYTFHGCIFHHCFLGGTRFEQVKFYKCSFKMCDFMHATFKNCKFEDCVFEKNTAFEIKFINSDIDSGLFVDSICVPRDNYSTAQERKEEENRLLKRRYEISSEVLRSVIGFGISDMLEIAIYTQRTCKLRYKIHKLFKNRKLYLRAGEDKLTWRERWEMTVDFFYIPKEYFVWGTTLFGTSLLILIGIFVVFNGILGPLILSSIDLISAHYPQVPYTEFLNVRNFFYFDRVLVSIKLFLGFGFTAYSTHSFPFVVLLFPSIGIIWAGLILPIIVRRIYR